MPEGRWESLLQSNTVMVAGILFLAGLAAGRFDGSVVLLAGITVIPFAISSVFLLSYSISEVKHQEVWSHRYLDAGTYSSYIGYVVLIITIVQLVLTLF